ncbi:uncharacterized protein KY384_000058 [Bacidia gigantensis]|uniref:uncharacterized protein n=1 Tax=Bacidia gigantensis TaxID=2732470 RepID=UPI001D058173|nr:uncharacterized protein KY384_000058 [Bacidia gigantensis]KAG8526465.1 hypothetical protein KY384_000058 [Bacidia gigantensis]
MYSIQVEAMFQVVSWYTKQAHTTDAKFTIFAGNTPVLGIKVTKWPPERNTDAAALNYNLMAEHTSFNTTGQPVTLRKYPTTVSTSPASPYSISTTNDTATPSLSMSSREGVTAIYRFQPPTLIEQGFFLALTWALVELARLAKDYSFRGNANYKLEDVPYDFDIISLQENEPTMKNEDIIEAVKYIATENVRLGILATTVGEIYWTRSGATRILGEVRLGGMLMSK